MNKLRKPNRFCSWKKERNGKFMWSVFFRAQNCDNLKDKLLVVIVSAARCHGEDGLLRSPVDWSE